MSSLEEVSVGDVGPQVVVEELTREDFVRYAGASGDFNPIHYDEPYATDAGNPSVFGQGMLTAGIAGNVATEWFGVAALRRFETRFVDRVWPGDTLVVEGEVTGVDGRTVTVELTGTADGREMLTGSFAVRLPE